MNNNSERYDGVRNRWGERKQQKDQWPLGKKKNEKKKDKAKGEGEVQCH